jgi:hypothetical protein
MAYTAHGLISDNINAERTGELNLSSDHIGHLGSCDCGEADCSLRDACTGLSCAWIAHRVGATPLPQSEALTSVYTSIIIVTINYVCTVRLCF